MEVGHADDEDDHGQLSLFLYLCEVKGGGEAARGRTHPALRVHLGRGSSRSVLGLLRWRSLSFSIVIERHSEGVSIS